MTRDEVAEEVRKCLRGLRADDDKPEYREMKYTALRPRVVFPGMLRFVLCDLMGFKCDWWPWDKIRWQVRAVYQDQPVAFEDRKMGFAIVLPETMSPEVRDELEKRLLGSMRILTRHLRAVSMEKVDAGRFTIVNRFHEHEGGYRYFRENAREAYAAPPPDPVSRVSADGRVRSTSYDPYKPQREGGWETVAMIHEFFSRLEHVLIMVLPSVPSFNPGDGRLRELMSAGWQEKYKAVFDLTNDHRAKQLFDRLVDVKEELRNPKAHGGFLKDGASAWFHMEGIGALPMDLLDHEFDRGMVPSPRYADICALFDEVDAMFDEHPRIGYGMRATRGGMDAKFDPTSLSEYRNAMTRAEISGSPGPFEEYLGAEAYAHDRHVNYEG